LRPPRDPREPLITRLLLARIIYVSALMITVTLIVFNWELSRGNSLETARTAAVNMLVVGELVYLFNVRHFTAHSLALTTLYGNRAALWMSLLLIGFQLLFTYAPPLRQMFQSTPLDSASWLLIAGLGLAKFFAVEAEKWLLRRFGIKQM
ncbi:MAG TPA: cation transporting ATPase C-terminal domain-containing protein, partial [Gammaproteobacteria bacterium]